MSDRIESMLKEVLQNQSQQDVKFAELATSVRVIGERGCSVGDSMVDELEKATKKDLAALRSETKNDTKDTHKRIDKFKIVAIILIVIGTILGLKGYPHAELW